MPETWHRSKSRHKFCRISLFSLVFQFLFYNKSFGVIFLSISFCFLPDCKTKSVPKMSENCFYCGEQCSEKCNDCHNVSFCCQEHFTFHKSRENQACLPFKVEKNQELGRYMIATRDIKPFETIVYDEALAFGPSEFNPPCCLVCLQALEDLSQVCPDCNVPLCSSDVSPPPFSIW